MPTLPAVLLILLAGTAWGADAATTSFADFNRSGEGWTFYGGWEFKGATGAVARVEDVGHAAKGAVRLSGDFTGGFYVGLKSPKLDKPAGEFAFWVKPEGIAHSMGLRLTDGMGQTFQYAVRLADGDGWQRVAVNPGTTTAQGHFGGENDGKWQGGISGAMICISKKDCRNGVSGAVLIDDVSVAAPR